MALRSQTTQWFRWGQALRLGAGLLGLCAVFVGCAATPASREPVVSPHAPLPSDAGFAVLAGEWEYEEGAASVDLIMDNAGRGTYAYKGGRFETTSLVGQEWRGRWIQTENDREGEFVIRLSANFQEGEGRWWYTRIGSVKNPPDKGGLFHLTRTGEEGDARAQPASY